MTVHTVMKGETLSTIARQHGVSVAELVRINQISNRDFIIIGQKIFTSEIQIPLELTRAVAIGEQFEDFSLQQGVICNCPKDTDEERIEIELDQVTDENLAALFTRLLLYSSITDGQYYSGTEFESGLASLNYNGHIWGNLGLSSELAMVEVSGNSHAGLTNNGAGGNVKTSGSLSRLDVTAYYGEDENNPMVELGIESKLLHYEASKERLIGSDGKKMGVSINKSGFISAISGVLKGEVNIPLPYKEWTVSVNATGGGSVGLGSSADVHGYKNLETDRYHLGLKGKIAPLIGPKATIDLSIGPKYPSRER